MKRIVYTLLLLAFFTTRINTGSFARTCLQKVICFFHLGALEKIDHKELSTDSLTAISIKNCNGSITIKTGWKKNHLCLKIIRRAKKQSDLDAIKIIADSTNSHHLAISTYCTQKKMKGSVEYELIVPTSLGVMLSTNKGDICINDIQGKIKAATKKGSICIENAQGEVEALSEYGAITIINAHSSVTARSIKGKVVVNYAALPHDSNVQLSTISGNIALTVPALINATVHCSTAYATVCSDHYITLSPYVTQLNYCAWAKFKKEVNGTIGSGKATISLTSTYGNINIFRDSSVA